MSTLVVCPSGCAFADVPSALAAAADGDTIVVRPGTYVGDIVVDKAVTLCATTSGGSACAPDPSNVILEGNATGSGKAVTLAQGATLRGFTVRNPGFAMSDQDAAANVMAALVDVGATGAQVLDNLLRSPAAALGAGETRWRTVAVHVEGDASGVLVRGNTMQDFVAPAAPLATCPSAGCKVIGVWAEGPAADLRLEENDIRVLGTGAPAAAIQVEDGSTGLVVLDNFLRIASSTAPATPASAVLYAGGTVRGALVEGNDMAMGLTEAPQGAYGVVGKFETSVFRANQARNLFRAIQLETAVPGDNAIEGNYFWDNHQPVYNYAEGTTLTANTFYIGVTAVMLDNAGVPGSSTNVTFRENVFRNHTTMLGVPEGVTGTYIDARENDWGSYSRDLIEARIAVESDTNTVDIACYIDNDGVTRVCPTADFTIATSGTSWPRTASLTDISTYAGGNTFGSRQWTLPGGASSTDETAVVSVMPGTHAATLTIVDNEGFEDTRTRVFSVANVAPILEAGEGHTATEGALFTLDLDGADADGDTLTYSLVGAPAGMGIAGATGVISWTPSSSQQGSHTFTVRASDGAAQGTDTMTIEVANVPLGPSIESIAPLTLHVGTAGQRVVRATTTSGVVPTLAASGVPAGAAFVDNGDGTGAFTWTPTAADIGGHSIVVTATAEGISATKTLQATVNAVVGLDLVRLGSTSAAQASPGDVVILRARVTNTGSGGDGATFSLTATDTWSRTTPAPIPLVAGESADVEFAVTVPANGDAAAFTLRACSQISPSICKQVTYRVEVPVFATLSFATPTFGPMDTPSGTVSVRFLNGAPAAGVAVTVEERSAVVSLLRSTGTGTTDAAGVATFELADPRAMLPGGHTVSATARWGEMSASAAGSYRALV